ncbi:MAG: 3-oxoadipate enol-lactonase [Terracidiphilus sp.]
MPTTDCVGASLHYEVSGNQRGGVLVLANSLGSNLHMWDKVLPAFESRYKVLRFDMRGHGESSVAQEPFGIEQLGHDVLRLLDEVGAKRASVCGLSLGGLVALWLGIHAPERVNRLILANTAARIGNREIWEQRIATARGAGMSCLAATMLDRWFTPGYREHHPEEMEQIRAMVAATDPDGYAACCVVLRDTDLRGQTENVRAASLVITGTHDPATPPGDGHALHAAIPNSRYVELDASHLSAWERAEEFADAVVQHLAVGEEVDG